MNHSFKRLLTLCFSLLMVFSVGFQGLPAPLPAGPDWRAKVDPWALSEAAQGETEILLLLSEQADLSGAARLQTKTEKGRYVFEQLTQTAERTQPALQRELAQNGLAFRSYWIANMIWARGDLAAIERLARRQDVAHIYANPWVRQAEPELAEQLLPEATAAIEWNLLKINADDVWAAGFTGQGAVVGGQDTGYDWTHPALKDHYRGWDGVNADHNYSWHDAIHENVPGSPPGNPCGFDSPVPCDDDSHGTHTMGTMVGDDGGANQIGVAPGAEWIGCRNMDDGWGSPATYSECYQWFLAPTDLNNANPRPDLAPDVINNSWGCPSVEGCTDPAILLAVVNNVRAAGIMTVHSAGNSGSGCETVNTPAAIYDASFTVGNTTSSDTIASSSSRGPVTVDGSGRMKPDISAPGTSIRSSITGGGYASLSGTSMAGPHVAGLVALLISAQPALAGQVDPLEEIIRTSAVPLSNLQTCGGVPAGQVPNNVFGFGRIDALSAVTSLAHTLSIQKTAPAVITSGELLTYTLTVEHQHSSSPTQNVVVSDTLPLGVAFVSATPAYTLDGRTVTWNFPSLAAGGAAKMELAVQVDASFNGLLTNDQYSASSDEAALVQGAPVSTQVQSLTGLEIDPGELWQARAGDFLTITHHVTNTSAAELTVNLELQSDLGWASVDLTPFTLGAGASKTVVIAVQVPETAAGGALETLTLIARADINPLIFARAENSVQVLHLKFFPLIFIARME